MVRQTPGSNRVTSPRPPWLRHMSPTPAVTYQISSTVACEIALAVCPGSSLNSAKLATPGSMHSGRTAEPSGAVISWASLRCVAAKRSVIKPTIDHELPRSKFRWLTLVAQVGNSGNEHRSGFLTVAGLPCQRVGISLLRKSWSCQKAVGGTGLFETPWLWGITREYGQHVRSGWTAQSASSSMILEPRNDVLDCYTGQLSSTVTPEPKAT